MSKKFFLILLSSLLILLVLSLGTGLWIYEQSKNNYLNKIDAQALDAKKAFLEGKFRPSNSSPHPDLGKPYKITKKTRGDVGILKKRK